MEASIACCFLFLVLLFFELKALLNPLDDGRLFNGELQFVFCDLDNLCRNAFCPDSGTSLVGLQIASEFQGLTMNQFISLFFTKPMHETFAFNSKIFTNKREPTEDFVYGTLFLVDDFLQL